MSPGSILMRFVVVQGDAMQHRQRLALAAGGEKRELIERQVVPTIAFGHEVARQMQIAQFCGDLAVTDHASPAQYDAPAATLGDIDDLLDPRDAR